MSRTKGAKGKKTLAREAEARARELAKVVDARRAEAIAAAGLKPIDMTIVIDALDLMEEAMRHFYFKAKIEEQGGLNTDWKKVDSAMMQAVAIAKEVAPYRHARLSAVKLAGDPNDPIRLMGAMTADELREQIMKQLEKLGPILDLAALPQGIANRLPPGVNGGGQEE